ncbi:MAG TPA: matrixin family metalloprotease, partial [Solirubrobacteraceae bacterium]|nr:matrixin family metalloprotease [Solirubrobacteraceae bacterium]
MGIDQNTSLKRPARRLAGTLAISLAAGACAIGVGPAATARVAPAVEGVAFSVSGPAGPVHAFHANDDGFTVNDTTGDAIADDAQFAVGSLALSDAETIAIHYWGVLPCQGNVAVSWQSLDPSINGVASWWNPVAAYGNAGANSECSISLNTAQDYSWPMLCTVVTHEIGHLTGHDHVTDQSNVMYPVYVGPISECLAAPIGVPGPPATVASKASTRRVSATAASHKTKAAKKKVTKK